MPELPAHTHRTPTLSRIVPSPPFAALTWRACDVADHISHSSICCGYCVWASRRPAGAPSARPEERARNQQRGTDNRRRLLADGVCSAAVLYAAASHCEHSRCKTSNTAAAAAAARCGSIQRAIPSAGPRRGAYQGFSRQTRQGRGRPEGKGS